MRSGAVLEHNLGALQAISVVVQTHYRMSENGRTATDEVSSTLVVTGRSQPDPEGTLPETQCGHSQAPPNVGLRMTQLHNLR